MLKKLTLLGDLGILIFCQVIDRLTDGQKLMHMRPNIVHAEVGLKSLTQNV